MAPIERLRELLETDWDDDGDRISVIVHPPPVAPTNKSTSFLPPQLDPKSPLARWVVTIIMALAAVGGGVQLVRDLLGG